MKVEAGHISYRLQIHRQSPSKPTLLLLHGFMGSGNVFSHLIPSLSRFCYPCTIDLLGHGETEDPGSTDRYRLDHQLRDLHHMVTHHIGAPLFLHGYSMGGRLAARYALRHPQNVLGLILESTNDGIADTRIREERLKTDRERALAIENNFAGFLEQWQRLPLFTSDTASEELAERYRAIQARQQPAAMARSLRGFGSATMPSVRNQLEKLELPVMLLAGERDSKYRKIMNEMDTLLPESKFHILRQAGHRVHLDAPQGFLERVRSFILCTGSQTKRYHRTEST